MNLEELGGISKSLFKYTAMIPRTKKSNAGFVRFSINKLRFMLFDLLDFVDNFSLYCLNYTCVH